MAEANKLCELLGKCTEGPLSRELYSEIASQRSAETQAHAEYNEHRLRLLAAARFGYRDSDRRA